MAKKKVQTMPTAEKTVNRVRLDLSLPDCERLEKHARKRGLSMASCARMVMLSWLDAADAEERENNPKNSRATR